LADPNKALGGETSERAASTYETTGCCKNMAAREYHLKGQNIKKGGEKSQFPNAEYKRGLVANDVVVLEQKKGEHERIGEKEGSWGA